jgi:hypothetical protein
VQRDALTREAGGEGGKSWTIDVITLLANVGRSHTHDNHHQRR